MIRKLIVTIFFIGIIFTSLEANPDFCIYSKWKDGKIPFSFVGKFNIKEIMLILDCMEQWERVCDIDFYWVPSNPYALNNIYYISKTNKDTSYSTMGSSTNKKRVMVLNKKWGVTKRVVLHELGHCLGLHHEHQRPDRDKYVKINFENVSKRYKYAVEKLTQKEFIYPIKKFKFDYCSIMLYSPYGSSKSSNKKSIDMDGKYCRKLKLSEGDIKKIQYVYGKPKIY